MALRRPWPSLRGIVPSLLRGDRSFRRFWIDETISPFGDQITYLALPLVGVLHLRATATQRGYLTAPPPPSAA